MTYGIRSIFVTFVLTLALTSAFGAKIIELRIDPVTGQLSLSDGGRTEAGWLGGVIWVIKDARIASFQIVEKSGNPWYIFTDPLPNVQGTRLHMKINFHINRCDWYYAINWMDTGHQLHPSDPKIAVRPIIGYTELFLLGFIVTSITSIMFFSKFPNAKAKIRVLETKVGVLEKKVNELTKNGPQNT